MSRRSQEGFAYIVKVKGRDVIKIGKANDPWKRLASLQTAHCEELEIVAVFPNGREQEADLHALFAPFRIRGEWFRLTPEVQAFLDNAKAGYP